METRITILDGGRCIAGQGLVWENRLLRIASRCSNVTERDGRPTLFRSHHLPLSSTLTSLTTRTGNRLA
jgi:hypothetical protein